MPTPYNHECDKRVLHTIFSVQQVSPRRTTPTLSQGSGLEAFSHFPADVSFVTTQFRMITFTIYLNKVFLSY